MSGLRTSMRSRIRRIGPIPAAVVALVLVAPSLFAGESHFTDVPPSNPFYVNINNIAGAGVTTGCTATTYCPKQAVTREQMAAFLNRTGPRLSIAYFAHPLGNVPGQQPANNAVVASTPVRAIGSEALLMRATFYTITYATGSTFPCEVRYRFRVDNNIVGNPLMYHRENAAPPNTWFTKPMTGEYAIVVGKGDHTVSLIYERVSANPCSVYPGNGVLIVEPIQYRWDLGTYGFGEEEQPIDVLGDTSPGPLLQSNGEPVD